jgi:hypothetical protein
MKRLRHKYVKTHNFVITSYSALMIITRAEKSDIYINMKVGYCLWKVSELLKPIWWYETCLLNITVYTGTKMELFS